MARREIRIIVTTEDSAEMHPVVTIESYRDNNLEYYVDSMIGNSISGLDDSDVSLLEIEENQIDVNGDGKLDGADNKILQDLARAALRLR